MPQLWFVPGAMRRTNSIGDFPQSPLSVLLRFFNLQNATSCDYYVKSFMLTSRRGKNRLHAKFPGRGIAMKKALRISLFLALSTALAFGSRIDQGSTDSGHTASCTPNDLGGTINDTTSPCVYFVQTGVGTGVVDSTFSGSTTTLDDVFTFNVSSNTGTVVFNPNPGFSLSSASYGLFLCSGPTSSDQGSGGSSATDYQSMAIVNSVGNGTGAFAPCMNIPEPDANISESAGSFTYNLAGLQTDGLTNNTLAFLVRDGQGFFSMESSTEVPEPSSVFLLLSGGIGILAARIRTVDKRRRTVR
jgi:hypothetical protein